MNLLSFIILFSGLGGLIGYAFNISWLRTYIPGTPPMPPMAAICFIAFSIALLVFSPQLKVAEPRKPGLSGIVGFLVSFSLSLIFLVQTLFRARSDITALLTSNMAAGMPFFAQLCFLLGNVALGLLIFQRKNKWLMLLGVGIPALLMMGISLFALSGFCLNIPGLYSFQMTVAGPINFLLMGIILLVISIPHGGLLQPMFSSSPRIRNFAMLSIALSFVIMASGVSSLASLHLSLQNTRPGALILTYLQLEVMILIITVLITVLSLRAIYFLEQAEKAIRYEKESEERFRLMAESTPLLIATTDTEGQGTYYNKAWLQYTGRTMDALLGKGWINCLYPGERDDFMAGFLEASHSKETFQWEHRLRQQDGSFQWFLIVAAPRFHTEGSFVGYVSTSTPIQALKESQQEYRALFTNALEAILIADNEGHYLNANPAACRKLGVPSTEDIVGKGVADFFFPDRKEAFIPMWEKFIEAGSMAGEMPYVTPNGVAKYFEFSAVANYMPNRHLSVLRDITEKKRVQNQLEESQKRLEQSNKELEHFASIASHDLQAPLRKILMFSDSLKSSLGDSVSEDSLHHLSRIESSALRMKELISSLLKLSRVTQKTQPFRPVHLGKILTGVLDDLQYDIQESGGCVTVGPMFTLEADEQQLGQLLSNLIGNALKYHREDKSPQIHCFSEIRDPWCRIIVEDNGIGIKQEHREGVFKVFQRLHGIGKYSGTGIGLAIVKKIVERHEGTVWIEDNRKDEGCRFVVEIPIRQSKF